MSQNNFFWLLRLAGVSFFYLAIHSRAYADVELPLLNQVPKIISVSDQFPREQVKRFKEVRNLTLELRLTRGNLVPDDWIEFLNNNLPNVPKRIVVKGALNSFHVGQIRKIKQVELHYTFNPGGIDSQTQNALFELGPIHKIIMLPDNFPVESLDSVNRLSFLLRLSMCRLSSFLRNNC